MKLGLAVLAYEAAETIEGVLGDLGPVAVEHDGRVLVADDHSHDATVETSRRWATAHPRIDVQVVSNPSNLGYGGNQKTAIAWARAQQLEVLVVLHGDAQHDAADIASMLEPIARGDADAVFAARTLVPGAARAGGMPLIRYVANRSLSRVQNLLAGTSFSEWHSGFRAYRVDALEEIDLAELPDCFDFDCAMTYALVDRDRRILEVPSTTRYADEVSRVPLVAYGLRVLHMAVSHRWRRARRADPARPAVIARRG